MKTRKRTSRHVASLTVAYAVFLGCTTPHRLAAEWGIPSSAASKMLYTAALRGLIRHDRERGTYATSKPYGRVA